MSEINNEESGLIVGGVVSLSTVDFPGHVSFTIFCQGCPWRCWYCHNRKLRSFLVEGLPWTDVLNLIDERKGFIDSVVFSGGEPTVNVGIEKAIQIMKKRGLLVALHTAGPSPDKLSSIINSINWVGLDIKAPANKYDAITGVKGSSIQAFKSLDILLASGIDYEIRVPMDTSFTIQDIISLLTTLKNLGIKNIALQNIRTSKNEIISHPILLDDIALQEASSMFNSFVIRNTT